MQILHEDKYVLIEHDAEHDVFKYYWKPENENLDLATYFEEGKIILEALLNCGATKVIHDGSDFVLSIPPEIQEKVSANLISKVNGIVEISELLVLKPSTIMD